MKKLLLVALVASGFAFVPVQRSDAQVYVGIPGVVGVGIGSPGYYYGYPYYGLSTIFVLLLGSLVLLVQRASGLLSPPSPSSLLPQLLS